MNEPTPRTPVPPLLGWLGLLIGWLIPGGGFILCGRRTRGLTHFFLVAVTFGIGISLHSAVAWPSWSIHDEEFNLINNFTFIVQLGSGLPALISFAAGHWPAMFRGLGRLGGIPQHPYYELGSYYLIVAGALNYFAIGNFYDRLVKPHLRFLAQEQALEESEDAEEGKSKT